MYESLLPSLLERFTVKYPTAPHHIVQEIIAASLDAADRSRAARRASRADANERKERIARMVTSGLTLGAIAAELNMSRPHVSQVVAQLRQEGVELPSFARGRPPAHVLSLSAMLPLFARAMSDEAIAQRLSMSVADIDRGRKLARARGNIVPTQEEADTWRSAYAAAARSCRVVAKAMAMPVWPEHHLGPKEDAINAERRARETYQRLQETAPSLGITSLPNEPLV